MRVFSEIGNKFVWFVIIFLLFGAGYVWVLKTFLNPPAVSIPTVATPPVPSNPAPAATPSAALPVTTPTDATPSPAVPSPSSPSATATTPVTPDSSNTSPSATPAASDATSTSQATSAAGNATSTSASPTTATAANTVNSGTASPALALPEQVAIKMPKVVEKGALLKIFYNNDNNDEPDPMLYSPMRTLKVPGFGFVPTSADKFSELSGYFLVKEAGIYNFAITLPSDAFYLSLSDIRLKIDGNLLPQKTGGRMELEPGWHYVSWFMKTGRSYPRLVRVSLAREGEDLRPIEVWREAQ